MQDKHGMNINDKKTFVPINGYYGTKLITALEVLSFTSLPLMAASYMDNINIFLKGLKGRLLTAT